MSSVGSRVQELPPDEQVLVLARLAQDRAEAGKFTPAAVATLFDEVALPPPSRVSNVLRSLEAAGDIVRTSQARGYWKVTPKGRDRLASIATDLDLAALVAESSRPTVTQFGATAHPVIPPSFAPPSLLGPLRAFLEDFPFERNVFGMTRFSGPGDPDPLGPALDVAAAVCSHHGLVFHLASDRSIVDDLWANVAAHMWACRFGIAFFEARAESGLNYNLSIEVGSCLVLGRRLALLKDESLAAMPTDLVGQIYLPVNLDDTTTVRESLTGWIQQTLRISSTRRPD